MKKPKIRRGLEKALLTGLIAGSSLLGLKGQVTEEAGFKAAMNPYSKPNIQMLEGRGSLDSYGSGDVILNDTVDFSDAEAIRNGTESGNDRADVNGDGIVNNSDAEMIEDYLNKEISYLPGKDWNDLNRQERIDWFTKMLEIDKTDERQYISGYYDCTDFTREHQINFFGMENFNNYLHADKFNEDGNDNARFNIPVYGVSTRVTNGGEGQTEPGGHAIIAILVGPESGERFAEDPTNLNHWLFVEPQLDKIVRPGDWSINEDEYVDIKWFGYYSYYGLFSPENLVKFELNGGEASGKNIHSKLNLTNPNAPDTIPPTATFPQDKTTEFKKGMSLDSVIMATPPTNVNDNEDPSPIISYTYNSEKTNDSTYTDVNFDVYVNWKVEDESGNDTTQTQKIQVRDNENPKATFANDTTVSFPANLETIIQKSQPKNVSDNSGLPVEISHTYESNQTSEGICSDVNYAVQVNWNVEDESGNKVTDTQNIYVVDDESPSFTTPADVYIKEGQSIEPDSTGMPTDLYDNSNLPVETSYTDLVESENDLEKIIRRTWKATDVCSNESEEDQYITIQKPDGINEKIFGSEMNLYPIPTTENLTLEYNSQESGKVHTEIYDLSGKLIDYETEEIFSGDNKMTLDVSDLKPGMYLLNFTKDEQTQTKKFIKR